MCCTLSLPIMMRIEYLVRFICKSSENSRQTFKAYAVCASPEKCGGIVVRPHPCAAKTAS